MGCGSSTPAEKNKASAAGGAAKGAAAMAGGAFNEEMGKKLHSAIRWDKPIAEIHALMPSAEAANFLDDRNGNTPMHIAAQNGHLHIVKAVIEKGGNLNTQNKGGQTPMHMAVAYDYDEVADFLKGKGADPMIKNNEGHCAQNGIDGDKAEKPDKADVVQAGLKIKKEKKDIWDADVAAKFQQCIQDL